MPVSEACKSLEKAGEPKPRMIGTSHGLQIGVSFSADTYRMGTPVQLEFWLDNSTDKPGWIQNCGDLDTLRLLTLRLFRDERLQRAEPVPNECPRHWNPHRIQQVTCFSNQWIQVPAHTCRTDKTFPYLRQEGNSKLRPGKYRLYVRNPPPLQFVCRPSEQAKFRRIPGEELSFQLVP